MGKTAFIVTSAINTRFGVFQPPERIQQTIDTINSIKARCPDAVIYLVEMAGIPLQPGQKSLLQEHVNVIIDFSSEPIVQQIYNSTENWDLVKNETEILCFRQALAIIGRHNSSVGVDRFVKVSGRYLLNEDFSISQFPGAEIIYFARRKNSQFDAKITGGVPHQYMSRCWSFPKSKLQQVFDTFKAMWIAMNTIVQQGGYLDIEHLLYLYMEPDDIVELDKIGVQGLLGPNGILVRD